MRCVFKKINSSPCFTLCRRTHSHVCHLLNPCKNKPIWQAREKLEWNETQDQIRLKRKATTPHREHERRANAFTSPKPLYALDQGQVDARQNLDASKLKDRHKLESRNLTGGLGGDISVEEGGEQARGAGEHFGGASKKGEKAGHITNDVAFVLRKLYTGGGLDAQQKGWKSLPMDLFNTLTLQLGTMSKVRLVCVRVRSWCVGARPG